MNGLILLSIGLIALTGSLCALLYARVSSLQIAVHDFQKHFGRIEVLMDEITQSQMQIQDRINQLSVDVIHREIYRFPEDRHQLAIKAAREGEGRLHLMQKFGLSSDEAELIISLHGQARIDSNLPDSREVVS